MRKTFSADSLAIINVASRNNSTDWANNLVDAVREINPEIMFAPDYDGTTSGDTSGINVLILESDLTFWLDACDANDLDATKSNIKVTAGHYGDGGWPGVDLEEDGNGNLIWIE